MASVSISHAIVFIASIVIAASVAGVLTTEVERVSQSIDEHGGDLSESIRTDIEIINDAGSSNCCFDSGTNNITLFVKNTGSLDLPTDPDQIDVFVNGAYTSDLGVTVVEGEDWQPESVVELEIHVPGGLSSGDHRVKVIVKGDEEVFEFRT